MRLKDYLVEELEKIATRENRSLANLVNHLLEQVVEMEMRMAVQRSLERGTNAKRESSAE